MIKVASIQMVSSSNPLDNFGSAERLIEQCAKNGAKIVVLPEYFCLLGHNDRQKLSIQEEFGSGPMQEKLANFAKTYQIYLVAGTLPISSNDPDRVWNSTLVFNPEGEIVTRYNKIHLFSFSKGSESYNESLTLQKGLEPHTFQVHDHHETWSFGLSICYDIRFPELYRAMGTVDCHLIPAAFTYTTGSAHWEILLRARAIENQCYVLASAQGGLHENGRKTWGHSMLISPWGEISTQLENGEGFILGELNRQELEDVRANLPALSHRTL
jgi:predicted amidohydrolase